MEGNRRISIIVGAFVLLGLAALALTILSLSSQQGVFRDRYRLVAYFDNSADNPQNPSSPPKAIKWGEKSTDEMLGTFYLEAELRLVNDLVFGKRFTEFAEWATPSYAKDPGGFRALPGMPTVPVQRLSP